MAVNGGEAAPGGKETGREQRAIALGFAHGETGVALRADAAHRGHPVIKVGVEILLDALAGVIGGLKSGPAAGAQVDVQVDQTGGQKLA